MQTVSAPQANEQSQESFTKQSSDQRESSEAHCRSALEKNKVAMSLWELGLREKPEEANPLRHFLYNGAHAGDKRLIRVPVSDVDRK